MPPCPPSRSDKRTHATAYLTLAPVRSAAHLTRESSTGKRPKTTMLSKQRAHGGTSRGSSHASIASMGGGAALIMASGGQRQREGHDGHEDARTRAAHLVLDTMCPTLVAKLVGHPGPATAIQAEMSQHQDAPGGQDSGSSSGSAGRAAKLRLVSAQKSAHNRSLLPYIRSLLTLFLSTQAKLQRGSLWAQGSLSTVGCRVGC